MPLTLTKHFKLTTRHVVVLIVLLGPPDSDIQA
ncbi:MAG: hypothetical protein JWQ04_955 [Pedosphaera sp.]|nr:hypothetical protein [Pedosphaera sp.]